ncbi:DNA translocase FtsK 4TM domain-containing protein [Acinetobacter bereziniae]|uniref:DNA translocase FtsK n=1 Tax=Acinetobacter bereziniae TaxID=106648 RepID=UPI0021CF4A02|nr:DNA translocase FtsK [Acinetobacter bereziniae]MCU4317438.1 DNA translocase FtsK 4TM domain-containing protein [Acinetobacter bereziniae]
MTAVSNVYAQRFLTTIFLISFGIYLFLATVTYTPFDPGWMHISSDTQQVSNASGVAGAWIADLLFGFLGWASLLIPVFMFIEAIQVWWPRSFVSRPFRYAAQFFILLATSSLLYLLWNVPADTLANASGGIIGYELGESLSQLMTIYGAVIFILILLIVLFTLAFGIQWNKTWAMLKATPAYLQDLFYKNVPESESAYDLTSPQKNKVHSHKAEPITAQAEFTEADQEQQPKEHLIVKNTKHNQTAERLFDDMIEQEHKAHQETHFDQDDIDDETLERTLEKAHRLEQDSQRTVSSGEVWKALNQDQDHNRDIDALLRASEDQTENKYPDHLPHAHTSVSHVETKQKSSLDWDDDQVFDELLSVVPNGQTATDIHTPFNANTAHTQVESTDTIQPTTSFANVAGATAPTVVTTSGLAHELDELASLADDPFAEAHDITHSEQSSIEPRTTAEARTTSSYAQSSPFTRANIQTHLAASTLVSEEEKSLISSDKDAFREAWQETAGKPQDELQTEFAELEDDFDLDAPLTDAFGRPMSRAMQVAQKRRDLPTLPGFELLDKVDPNKKVNFTAEQLSRLSELLEIKLQEFNVKAKVIEAQPGPVVTRFELDLAPGVKASKVTNISRDLARSMSMASVRVVEVIPGKPYIGIEVPNSSREMVRLIELLETPAFRDPNGLLSMAMGKDISGNPVITDLGKAPHMLVAGTTGSGKSVAVNSMILSMLLKYTPDQLRLILIDPKQLELANYNDIPHLLTPVVTDMKDAVSALNWCVNEMERRYKLMSFLKIRKLADYNRKVEEAIANGEDLIDPTWKASDSATQERAPRLQPLPSIVIVADEFADMIMQVGKKAEEMITRLAQKSRAAGIHLLLATQRPSVDVITGLIKANIPTRVALRVNSKIDSRTILDGGGAEDLLGHGDMLFLGPGKIDPERVHGAFISDDEVNRICDAWRERGEPNYIDEILTPFDEEPTSRGFDDGDGDPNRDALYDQCVSFVLETRKVSVSSLQRKFSLGYNRAARIVDQMQEQGIVSEQGPNGKRDILV